MIEHLKDVNDLDRVLSKMGEKELSQLYLRVFSSKEGELVLQDLANRCYVYDSAVMGIEDITMREGMRAMWLSIQTRLRSAVETKEE